jgi:hypothetical protein
MTTEPEAPEKPPCTLCGAPAVVHWQRRLTPAEVAIEQAKEQARRDEADLLADKQKPPTLWPPLPDCADFTRIVHGCLHHAIGRDAAALVHQATCTAPNADHLPGCDCEPEAPPKAQPEPVAAELPDGW